MNRGSRIGGSGDQGILQRDMVDAKPVRREWEIVCPAIGRLCLTVGDDDMSAAPGAGSKVLIPGNLRNLGEPGRNPRTPDASG